VTKTDILQSRSRTETSEEPIEHEKEVYMGNKDRKKDKKKPKKTATKKASPPSVK
jgi:hypothetical protein